LSIEQILDATAILAEQAATAQKEQDVQLQELYKKGPQVDVFEWADLHGSGGWE